MKLLIVLAICSLSIQASELKFKYRDKVRIAKKACDDTCKFYRLDRKDPGCFVQSYGMFGEHKEIPIYRVNCDGVPELLSKQNDELELVK